MSDESDLADVDEAPTGISEKFIERLTRIFAESFERCVDRLIASLEERLHQRLEVQETFLFDVNARLDSLDRENSNLKDSITELRQELSVMKTKYDQLETHCDVSNSTLVQQTCCYMDLRSSKTRICPEYS